MATWLSRLVLNECLARQRRQARRDNILPILGSPALDLEEACVMDAPGSPSPDGDEAKWTDVLRMHEVIASAVDPTTALAVGLKVDADALPQAVKDGIADGSVDLTSPATTVALLKLNAVLGVQGTVESVNGVDHLRRVGITCALCQSTVDNSFAPGIGKQRDGWPNRAQYLKAL